MIGRRDVVAGCEGKAIDEGDDFHQFSQILGVGVPAAQGAISTA